MGNREKFRHQKVVEEKINRRTSIRDYAKKLYRKTKDSEIRLMLERENNGTVTTEFFENWIKERESKEEIPNG